MRSKSASDRFADIDAGGVDRHADMKLARHDLRRIERRGRFDGRYFEGRRSRRGLRTRRACARSTAAAHSNAAPVIAGNLFCFIYRSE